ncbi:unnamed protein product, partial [Closterium sp. NIES-64]
ESHHHCIYPSDHPAHPQPRSLFSKSPTLSAVAPLPPLTPCRGRYPSGSSAALSPVPCYDHCIHPSDHPSHPQPSSLQQEPNPCLPSYHATRPIPRTCYPSQVPLGCSFFPVPCYDHCLHPSAHPSHPQPSSLQQEPHPLPPSYHATRPIPRTCYPSQVPLGCSFFPVPCYDHCLHPSAHPSHSHRALFSKSPTLSAVASRVASSLSYLAPRVTLPVVLESFQGALTTVTATHQLESALSTLALSVHPLLLVVTTHQLESALSTLALSVRPLLLAAAQTLTDQDSTLDSMEVDGSGAVGAGEGGGMDTWQEMIGRAREVVSEALVATLPGIDANDPPKTLATLHLYLSVFSSVRILGVLLPLLLWRALQQALRGEQFYRCSYQASTFFSLLSCLFSLFSHLESVAPTATVAGAAAGTERSFLMKEAGEQPSAPPSFLMKEAEGSTFRSTVSTLFARLSPPLLNQVLSRVERYVSGTVVRGCEGEIGTVVVLSRVERYVSGSVICGYEEETGTVISRVERYVSSSVVRGCEEEIGTVVAALAYAAPDALQYEIAIARSLFCPASQTGALKGGALCVQVISRVERYVSSSVVRGCEEEIGTLVAALASSQGWSAMCPALSSAGVISRVERYVSRSVVRGCEEEIGTLVAALASSQGWSAMCPALSSAGVRRRSAHSWQRWRHLKGERYVSSSVVRGCEEEIGTLVAALAYAAPDAFTKDLLLPLLFLTTQQVISRVERYVSRSVVRGCEEEIRHTLGSVGVISRVERYVSELCRPRVVRRRSAHSWQRWRHLRVERYVSSSVVRGCEEEIGTLVASVGVISRVERFVSSSVVPRDSQNILQHHEFPHHLHYLTFLIAVCRPSLPLLLPPAQLPANQLSTTQEATVLFHMHLVSNAVPFSGSALIAHKNRLIALIDAAFSSTSQKVVDSAADLLQKFLFALIFYYPLNEYT